MRFDNSFGEEELRLRDYYPNESLYCDDRSVWYSGDVYHLFSPAGTHALPQAVRSNGRGEQAPYWMPPPYMLAHMRDVVAEPQNIRRLVLPTSKNKKKPNPNFSRFPVNYGLRDPTLAAFEIDDTIRVRSLTHEAFEIERATYLDQLATNIWPDRIPLGRTETLRQSETNTGRLPTLSPDSCFANTLGAALVLIDKSGIPLLRFRGRPGDTQERQEGSRLAVMEKGWHCAASGVTTWQDLNWSEAPATGLDTQWLIGGVERGMWRELEEETGLLPSDGITMIPLAFARELKRAGKPNFFFVAEASGKSCSDLQRIIESRNPPDKDEYSEGTWRERPRLGDPTTWFSVLVDEKPVAFLAKKELRLGNLATYVSTEAGTTGFTYENYAALRVAANWWSLARGQ